jgi:hypothetical protein
MDASPACSDSSARPSRRWPARLSVPVAVRLAERRLGTVSALLIGRAVFAPADGAEVSARFRFQPFTPLEYLWPQASVVLHYLRLMFRPSPLSWPPCWLIAAGSKTR